MRMSGLPVEEMLEAASCVCPREDADGWDSWLHPGACNCIQNPRGCEPSFPFCCPPFCIYEMDLLMFAAGPEQEDQPLRP